MSSRTSISVNNDLSCHFSEMKLLKKLTSFSRRHFMTSKIHQVTKFLVDFIFITVKPSDELSCCRSDIQKNWQMASYFVVIWLCCHRHRNLQRQRALTKNLSHHELINIWNCDHPSPLTSTGSHQELVTLIKSLPFKSYLQELVRVQR